MQTSNPFHSATKTVIEKSITNLFLTFSSILKIIFDVFSSYCSVFCIIWETQISKYIRDKEELRLLEDLVFIFLKDELVRRLVNIWKFIGIFIGQTDIVRSLHTFCHKNGEKYLWKYYV